VAQAVFWILLAASLLMAPSLRRDPYWHQLFIYSIISAIRPDIMIGIRLAGWYGWFGLFGEILVLDEIVGQK
jgi:hypothetical protein